MIKTSGKHSLPIQFREGQSLKHMSFEGILAPSVAPLLLLLDARYRALCQVADRPRKSRERKVLIWRLGYVIILDRQGMSLLLRDVKRKSSKCICGIIMHWMIFENRVNLKSVRLQYGFYVFSML